MSDSPVLRSSEGWTPEPRLYEAWSVEVIGSTQRLTEDGRLRVTEQGNIRIIEHFDIKWSNETTTINPWTQE